MPINKVLIALLCSVTLWAQAPITSDNAFASLFPLSSLELTWNSTAGSSSITSQTTAVEFCGPAYPSSSGSLTVSSIETDFGTNVYAGASTFNVQIFAAATASQPTSPTTGANSYLATTATLTSGSVVTQSNARTSFALTGNYTLTAGSVYCVVFSYAASGFSGSDSLKFQYIPARITFNDSVIATGTSWTNGGGTATWTNVAGDMNPMVLICSDGTYATLGRAYPTRGGSTLTSFNSGSGTKEYGSAFTFPNSILVTGVCANSVGGGGSILLPTFTLYTGANPGTSAATAAYSSANTGGNGNTVMVCWPFSSNVVIGANQQFWIGLKGGNANNLSFYTQAVGSAAEMTVLDGGQNVYVVSRATAGSGSWTNTFTSRPSLSVMYTQWGNKGGSGSQH